MMPLMWFKIGDQVRVLDGFHAGCQGVIININRSYMHPFEVQMINLIKPRYKSCELSLMIAEERKMKFKVEDEVKINFHTDSIFNGELAQITGINVDNTTHDIHRIKLQGYSNWSMREFNIAACFLEHSNVGIGSTVTIDPVTGAGFVENSFDKKCKLCKGAGRLLMLNNYVPCDCQTNIGVY